MVRALLAGKKTQTRRNVKPRKDLGFGCLLVPGELAGEVNNGSYENSPYGQPGDRLWVRENGWERPERTPKMMREGADTWAPYYYDAYGWDEQDRADFKQWGFKCRPSIHMPRWASRITLEIVSVRVERLQDISEKDCMAEGISLNACVSAGCLSAWDVSEIGRQSYRLGYANLWQSINGPGSWAANPYVWVIEFKKAINK